MTAFYMYISIIWFIPIMGWTLLNETKFKKNIVLGVTLPKEAHDDPEVVKELSAFKKKLLLVLLLLAVIGLVLFIPGLSDYKMTVWMTWVDLIIFLHRRMVGEAELFIGIGYPLIGFCCNIGKQ